MADEDSKKQLLGEILIQRKMITNDQLAKALEAQKADSSYIGEILIKLGFADERDILVALVVQCNLPYLAIEKYAIDKEILKILTKEQTLKLQSIPVDRVGETLSVVMANPLDLTTREELKRLTNMRIAPFIATRAEISRAIERWYK